MIGRSILRSGLAQQQNAPGAPVYAADVLQYGSGPPKQRKGETPYGTGMGIGDISTPNSQWWVQTYGETNLVRERYLPTPSQALASMRLTCAQWAGMGDDEHFQRVGMMMRGESPLPQSKPGFNVQYGFVASLSQGQAREVRSVITAINAECLRQGVQAQDEIGRSAQNVYDYGTRGQK